MKRLFWDIETSPNIVLSWKAGYDIDIPFTNIIKERAIIAIGWKWQGERKVNAYTWDKNQDDKAMLEAFIPVLKEADEIVAHYGDSFDIKWFRGRCLKHKLLKRLPPFTTVDTYKWAKRLFLLNSNKLDYLAQFTGVGEKIKTDYSLWKNIMLDKCDNSMDKMVRYLKRDVRILERVFDQMSVIAPIKTHVGMFDGKSKLSCPRCGKDGRVHHSKAKVSASGITKHQMQCYTCGGYFTLSDTVYNKEKAWL